MTSASTAAPTAAQDRLTLENLTYENPTYENLTGDHDWETHLRPPPRGELLVSGDYCTECGAGLRLLLDQDGAILAARWTSSPATSHAHRTCSPCRTAGWSPRTPRPAGWSCGSATTARSRRGPSLPFRSRRERLPTEVPALGPEMTPAFGEMLRQHRWREDPGGSPYRGRHVHDCGLCRARDARLPGPAGPRGHGPGGAARLPGVPLPRR